MRHTMKGLETMLTFIRVTWVSAANADSARRAHPPTHPTGGMVKDSAIPHGPRQPPLTVCAVQRKPRVPGKPGPLETDPLRAR